MGLHHHRKVKCDVSPFGGSPAWLEDDPCEPDILQGLIEILFHALSILANDLEMAFSRKQLVQFVLVQLSHMNLLNRGLTGSQMIRDSLPDRLWGLRWGASRWGLFVSSNQ